MTKIKSKLAAILIAMAGAAGMLTVPNVIVPAEHFSVCAAESAMSAPTAPKSEPGLDNVKLSWNKVSGADAYTVFIKKNEKDEYKKYKTVRAPECLIKDLKPGTSYIVKVTPVKLDSKSVITEKGKPGFFKIKTSVYKDCVQNLQVTTQLGGSKTEMYAGGEMINYSRSNATLSWDSLPSADDYAIYINSSRRTDCTIYKKNGRVYADIGSLYSGHKIKATVYPIKKSNNKEYMGKGHAINFTTATPKFSQLLDLGEDDSYISMGNNTYLSTGEYSAFAEEFSIATRWALRGGDLETLSTDVKNLDRHYIMYEDTKIGVINFYTSPYDPNYLKVVIQDF